MVTKKKINIKDFKTFKTERVFHKDEEYNFIHLSKDGKDPIKDNPKLDGNLGFDELMDGIKKALINGERFMKDIVEDMYFKDEDADIIRALVLRKFLDARIDYHKEKHKGDKTEKRSTEFFERVINEGIVIKGVEDGDGRRGIIWKKKI